MLEVYNFTLLIYIIMTEYEQLKKYIEKNGKKLPEEILIRLNDILMRLEKENKED